MEPSGSERRKYKRQPLSCPVKVHDDKGQVLTTCRTLNISNGGMFVPLPMKGLPSIHSRIKLKFSVPRETANAMIYEEFSCQASVVRQEPLKDDRYVGIALAFSRTVQLAVDA